MLCNVKCCDLYCVMWSIVTYIVSCGVLWLTLCYVVCCYLHCVIWSVVTYIVSCGVLWLTLCHVKCCDLHCVMWSVVTYMLCHVQCCDLHSCCWMLWLTLYQSYYVCYEWLWLCNYVLYFVNFALANTFNFLLPINFSSSHPLVRPIQEYPPMVVIGIHQKSMLVVSVDCAMPGCDSCVMLSCDPLWHCDTSEGRWPGRPRTVSSSTYLDLSGHCCCRQIVGSSSN